VREAGNVHARELLDDVYEVCDRPWRGLGTIADGGFCLREKWRRFDAAARFTRPEQASSDLSRCRSGDVLTGRIKPTECEHFGVACTPATPLGAPMVSAEGACAAYFRYAPPVAEASRETDR
jgi:hydrogenase expression/formation protein HypD